jgi:MFS family permease
LFFLAPYAGVNQIIYYSFAAFSAILGSLISHKIDRRKFLWAWITLGILSTVVLALVLQGTLFFILSSMLLGVSVGLGLPSCTAFFADYTEIEERARISGIIILETFLMVMLYFLIVSALNLGTVLSIFLIAALRSTSFLALILDRSKKEKPAERPYRKILTERDFSLYLLPWLLFNFAAGLSYWWNVPDTPEFNFAHSVGLALFYVCVATFGLVSGFAADRFGRKQPIVVGLVMLGVSFALLGYQLNEWSFLLYQVTLGIAWGFLLVVYLAIPGDIASIYAKEKFYAIGYIIPFILFIGLAAVPQLLNINVSIGVLSPILSILLFLAIIPILRAKETLPIKKLEARKMKEHLEKIGELIKESKTSH